MKVFLYSHTHWDREWYLSQTQFQFRLIRTLDEIIALIDARNGFDVFVLDGQTSVLQDYLELRPEREADLRRLIGAGKLIIGPWYSMPDDFLAGGEALIRNLLRGQADCHKYGAPYPNTGYVPDSFGHIEQMPQILRGVGIDNFIFGRGRPVALDTAAGHKQEFLWRAPDGSTVFAWNLPESYTGARFLPRPDKPEALKERIRRIIATYKHSHRPDLVLGAHGIDHCWLQRDIAAILQALPALMPDVEFHHGSLEDAVREWKRALPANLEIWEGQLRGRLQIGELHGTLSSRMDNKLANARARMFLENLAEPLDAIAGRLGMPAAHCHLRKAWELTLQNHAHDSICGCSQDRVHDEVNARFLKVCEIGTDVADAALDLLNNDARRLNQPGLIAYAGLNGGHAVVEFVLRLPKRPPQNLCLAGADGVLHRVQIEHVERLRIVHTNAEVPCFEARGVVHLPNLQPAEVRRLTFARGQPLEPAHPVHTGLTFLDNGLLRIEVQPNGTLDLTDPRTGRHIVGTHYFAQEADLGGGYHFEPLAGDARRDTRNCKARIRRLPSGPLRGRLEITVRLAVPARYDRIRKRRMGKAVLVFVSVLTLEADSDTLKVTTRLLNTASHQRVRLILPSGIPGATVHADASFAVHANEPERWPAEPQQNFHPMRSFVASSDAAGGLAFLGRGQHEYEIVPRTEETDLEITLLRSVDFVFLCSTWETPGAQLHGEQIHEYALRLFVGDWREGGVVESATTFLNPPVASVHGDSLHPCEDEDHATIGFYATRLNGVEVPVDTNRSPWHATNAHRDGWRRIEADRFCDREVPARMVPFEIEGEHLLVSAFKRADSGRGEVLRFWSASAVEQTVTVRGGTPQTRLRRADLLEQPLPDTPEGVGSLAIRVRPFEIVTIRMACETP